MQGHLLEGLVLLALYTGERGPRHAMSPFAGKATRARHDRSPSLALSLLAGSTPLSVDIRGRTRDKLEEGVRISMHLRSAVY
jgi:hypothetical protein